MAFFKVDDILLSHWRAKVADGPGIGIWTMGGVYCTTNLTDGHIPHVVAKTLVTSSRLAIRKVLEAGLWLECEEHEACFLMRAYHQDSSGGKRQPTKVEAEAAKVDARQRQARRRRNQKGQFEEGLSLDDQADVTDVSQRDTPVSHTTQSNPIQESKDSSEPREAARSNEIRVTEGEFARWYDTFPRHEAREKAKAAYKNARKKAATDELLAGAQRYRDDPNREAPFTTLPATWLNQGRWGDDPLPARTEQGATPAPKQSIRERYAGTEL